MANIVWHGIGWGINVTIGRYSVMLSLKDISGYPSWAIRKRNAWLHCWTREGGLESFTEF